jgi:hypothetical protein
MSFESDQAKIKEIADKLRVNPAWLDALINFETGGSYDPLKQGPAITGARGLIQVIDSTARTTFGYADSLSLVQDYPDFDSQMDSVVYPYLKHYMPFTTQQSLYMAVFYPAYRFVDPNTKFPDNVIAVNPGINTPRDYINFVNKRIRQSSMHFPMSGIPLAIIAVVVYFLYKKFS